ncbi:MAG: hypothetical protein KDJ65_06425 [Anaerolineae bacterium]|nr:hypothetical protein [Anaerolineae bacterium]
MQPFILLSLLLGGVFGTLFHLWRGKSMRDLILYLLAGIIGFVLGQSIAMIMGFEMWLIGSLHIVEATIASWGGLFLVDWLKI